MSRTVAAYPTNEEVSRKAAAGDLAARMELAARAIDHQTEARDPKEIRTVFAEGMRQGMADAYAGMALCYQNGITVEKDELRAYLLAEKAAAMGSAAGYRQMALMRMQGVYFRTDRKLAKFQLEKAASMGDMEARFMCALYKFRENGYSINPDMKAMRELAEQGYPPAMLKVVGTPGDDEAGAKKYMDQLLAMDYPPALLKVAQRGPRSFRTYKSVEENAFAVDCFRRAARKGDPTAIGKLGQCLLLQPAHAQKGESWVELMEEASDKGYLLAQDILGAEFYKGKFSKIEPDWARAAKHLERTLHSRSFGRFYYLGLMYIKGGHGLEKDPVKAFALIRKFAPRHPEIYRIIGDMLMSYEPFVGKEWYKVRAYACFLTYQRNHPNPREELLEKRRKELNLTSAQMEMAEKLSQEEYPSKDHHSLYPEGHYAPEKIVAELLQIKKEKGIPAAIDRLNELVEIINYPRCADTRMQLREYDDKLHYYLFKEAQVRSGREEPEWGLALYEWLYNDGIKHPGAYSAEVILHNYVVYLRMTNRLAKSRQVLNYWKQLYRVNGFETDPDLLPSSGPAFPEFPQVRRVRFSGNRRLNTYTASFCELLARQYYSEGQWRKSLEVNKALNTAVAGLKPPGKWLVFREEASEDIAGMFNYMGFERRAKELYQEIVTSPHGGSYLGRTILSARLELENLGMRDGEVNQATLERLEKLKKQVSGNQYLSVGKTRSVERAIIKALFKSGQQELAWQRLEKLFKDHPEDHNVVRSWAYYHIEHNRLDGVEPVLTSLLTYVRREGHKPSEIRIYELYARFLKKSGRYTEAIQMQLELVRLLRSFDIFTKLPLSMLELADIYALAGNLERAEFYRKRVSGLLESGRRYPDHIAKEARERLGRKLVGGEEDPEEQPGAKFQPMESVSVPLSGFPARGLIVLTNPGSEAITGQVTVSGNHRSVTLDPESGNIHVSIPVKQTEKNRSTVPLRLKAGETRVFDLSTSTVSGDAEGELQMLWIPDQGAQEKAVWSYQPSEEIASATVVVDAGVYSNNPFYTVPIYHLIQTNDKARVPTDLRVVASQQARVEIYNERGQLVLIDANGDGDLDDQGDTLVSDANDNGKGDITIPDARNSARFLVTVQPLGKIKAGGMSVSLQVLGPDGEWQKLSVDRLLPPVKAAGGSR